MLFAVLAKLLSYIRLFGLAVFSVDQRSKEVVMRKVLGDSRMQIVNTLVKEYMVWMTISVLVAVHDTYFLVEWWLSCFKMRRSQNAGLYLAAATLTYAIYWLKFAGISMRVASRMPGLMLRSFDLVDWSRKDTASPPFAIIARIAEAGRTLCSCGRELILVWSTT